MIQRKLIPIRFEPNNSEFNGFLPLEDLVKMEADPESLLRQAANVYKTWIDRMHSVLADIQSFRKSYKPIPARTVWELGDLGFRLRDDMAKLELQLDGFYDHLVRDLGVKRKWLEKVVILRRYIPEQDILPASLNWGQCEKGTRRAAEELLRTRSADPNAV